MKYIFIDESGDLGFKKTSSKWFIFCAVIVDDSRLLEKITKKVWKILKNKKMGELHASHESDVIRRRLLGMIKNTISIKITCVILDKSEISKKFQSDKNLIYRYILSKIIEQIFKDKLVEENENALVCIDKKDSQKSVRDNLINFLISKSSFMNKDMVYVTLESSHDNKSLQVVDFISWAIFRKYEKDDLKFYNLINNKIVKESAISLKKESPLL